MEKHMEVRPALSYYSWLDITIVGFIFKFDLKHPNH